MNAQIVASAPGRLDVMGGIADYSGSLVLQLPLDRRTTVRLSALDEPRITVTSVREGRAIKRSIDLSDIRDLPAAALALRYPPGTEHHWLSYVAGVAHAILHGVIPRGTREARGFALDIASDVPEGKGVSSSAALEVACYAAIARFYDVELTPAAVAVACQWAENHIAGAPCGVMDQMASACGRRDHLLRLRCQPAIVEGLVAIPPGFRFYGIDSGIRHAVTGADYGAVRTAAFMGYRMIAGLAGLPARTLEGLAYVDDDHWHGYLANISPGEYESRFQAHLPDRLLGSDFLARYGGITDRVTSIKPDQVYAVRVATAHPIRENARVERFAELLSERGAGEDTKIAHSLGELMYASHDSYSACGLGSEGTDLLVRLIQAAGVGRGLFGAKVTGGGSGGTVAILGTADAELAVRAIAREYQATSGRAAEVFAGSSDGLTLGS